MFNIILGSPKLGVLYKFKHPFSSEYCSQWHSGGCVILYIPYSLYSAPLFISGPLGAYWRGGGLIEREGAYLFIQKTSNGDYLFELQ